MDLFQLSGAPQGGKSSFSLKSAKFSICNLDWYFLHVQLFVIAVQFGSIGFCVFNFVSWNESFGSVGWHFWLYCKKLPYHTAGQEQACTRITRLSFGWLSPCRKWRNTQENSFFRCPIVITSKMTPFSRPHQTGNNWSSQSFAQLTLGHVCY